LALALVAIFAGLHFGITAVGVVVFLLGGHAVRRELARRGYWQGSSAATAGEQSPAAEATSDEAAATGSNGDDDSSEAGRPGER
jgi:uncharacterized membrane protein YiaA